MGHPNPDSACASTRNAAARATCAPGRGSRHGDWLGVSSLWTRADLRATGLGAAVLRSLLEWGAERGATTTYLQVVVANATAQEIYQARGYEVHHRYDYLAADLT